ncbi:hypothetical protein GTA51_06315 [Desulfovibrio aerotolerans]|uniref:Uncharacterized protein n=1 Tax=Solidesulfovibrio aerotolerans TaxID=295255 RepID=A0A7C9MEM9_9BACT|nr:hypothetical protein [Solidesulfovibrio aerotolerans]MYL82750.1 hypothetical protein [Solidesulfovibrio aerotolerans]
MRDFHSFESTPIIIEEVVTALKQDVVPLIVDSCRIARDAYDLDPEFNDNYTLGTYSWRNLFNRSRELDKFSWDVKRSENDLRLYYKKSSWPRSLRVHRCDELTRIPTGGKRAKKVACGQGFLSFEVENLAFENYELVIVYDFDAFRGLGKIQVVKLSGVSLREVLALPVATLYQAEPIDVLDIEGTPAPEIIADAAPSRDISKDITANKPKIVFKNE